MIKRTFSLVTYGFPHGAYQSQNINQPELRVPSIRGHLRWWYDALFPVARPADKRSRPSDELFGQILKPAQAGRLIVRVETLEQNIHHNQPFMPHKGQRGGEKNALAPGSSYQLIITERRRGINQEERSKMERCVDVWLLLGSIGQRANRAGGSIQPESAISSEQEFYQKAEALLDGSQIRVALLDGSYDNEKQIRDVSGDFLADGAFQRDSTPFGSARPRKPSLLKLKAIVVSGDLRIVALWDGRFQASHTLQSAVTKLAEDKQIGRLLKPALPRLIS